MFLGRVRDRRGPGRRGRIARREGPASGRLGLSLREGARAILSARRCAHSRFVMTPATASMSSWWFGYPGIKLHVSALKGLRPAARSTVSATYAWPANHFSLHSRPVRMLQRRRSPFARLRASRAYGAAVEEVRGPAVAPQPIQRFGPWWRHHRQQGRY